MSNLIYKSLDLPATTYSILHTVTTGKQASFTVNFTNRTDSEVPVRLAISMSDAPALGEFQEYDAKLLPNGVLERSGLLAPAGARIIGYPGIAGVSAQAWIYED